MRPVGVNTFMIYFLPSMIAVCPQARYCRCDDLPGGLVETNAPVRFRTGKAGIGKRIISAHMAKVSHKQSGIKFVFISIPEVSSVDVL
jgi:hypothetical protein